MSVDVSLHQLQASVFLKVGAVVFENHQITIIEGNCCVSRVKFVGIFHQVVVRRYTILRFIHLRLHINVFSLALVLISDATVNDFLLAACSHGLPNHEHQ